VVAARIDAGMTHTPVRSAADPTGDSRPIADYLLEHLPTGSLVRTEALTVYRQDGTHWTLTGAPASARAITTSHLRGYSRRFRVLTP
jgi:hypothetical protein